MKTATARLTRCRYTRRDGNKCPNPAADDAVDAHIVLCAAHLYKALLCIRENRAKVLS